MARPMRPLVRSGGYYPSNKWTPLVYPSGYTTMNGGEEPEPPTPVYWKTITGVSPLTLVNALAKPIRSLIQYGKCVQSGTPTPSAPVDIVCNNGAFKVRRQSGLPLAYQMVEWLIPAGAIPITGFKTKSAQEIATVFYRERGGVAYLYASDTATSGTTNTTAYITSGSGNWRWNGKFASISVPTGTKITSIQKSEGVWLNGTKYGSYTDPGEFTSTNDLRVSSSENTTIRIESQTIREGEIVTLDLVPVQRLTDSAYGFYDKVSGEFYTNAEATITAGDPIADPIKIYTDGEGEVLTVRGNLLPRDGETTGRIIGADGTVSDNSAYCISAPFVLPAGDYTCTWNVGSAGIKPFSVFACDADGTPKTDGRIFYKARSEADINTDEFAVEAETLVVASYRRNVTDLAIYSHAQAASVSDLFAAGDVKDEQDIITGAITRRVGVKVLTGEEPFSLYQSSCWAANVFDDHPKASGNALSICSHYAWTTSSVSGMADGSFLLNGTARLCIKDSRFETAAQFRAGIAAQYAAGTPVIVFYPLAEATTESVTPQPLRTAAGDNTVSVASEVDPVELSVEYAQTESGDT